MDIFTSFHDPDKRPESSPKLAVKIVVTLLVLLVITITVKWCRALISNKEKATPPPMLVRKNNSIIVPENSPLRSQLVIQTVSTSKKPHIEVLPGMVEANPSLTVNIMPPAAGHLIDLNIKLGDDVQLNQLMATIQSSALAQAYSDLTKAVSIQKQTEEALNRARKVNKAGANAIKDIEQARNDYTQAFAELQRAQGALKSLGTNQKSQLHIQAPIEGKVIALNYGVGSYINDITSPIFTVSNIQSVFVTVCVPEHLIALVKKGQKTQVSLTAYPNETWDGNISFINYLIDPDTRCNKTRITFTNPENKLQPNMFAKVRVEFPQQEQVLVPLSAILMNDDTTSVYVEIAPWTFESRAVELGTEDKNAVRITSGLKSSDRIVVSGGIFVND